MQVNLLHAQQDAVRKLTGAGGLENAAIGISVKEVATGKVVAEYQPNVSLHPASVTKLIPTALALKLKGEGYRYGTNVYYTGAIRNGVLEGNVVVEPAGDPTPDSKYFPEPGFVRGVTEALKKSGVRSVQGGILVDGKDTEAVPGSWPWEDVSNYYGAQHHLFNYRDNSYTIEFKSGEAGKPVTLVSVTPKQPGVRFENLVTASAKNGDDAWIFGGPYSGVMCVKGTIPARRSSFQIRGAMHRPYACFAEELAELLRAAGVPVRGEKLTSAGKQLLYSHVSPPLKEIVYHTNKSSVNLFAEALGTLVAGEDRENGLKKLMQEWGLDVSGVILKDACGLSHLNAVPAAVFTNLLIKAQKELGAVFVQSLPVAGVDGSLNAYVRDHALLKNNLKAKTGSFAGVRCLSGYVKNSSGQLLAFTVLINNYTCDSSRLYAAVGTFLSSLAEG